MADTQSTYDFKKMAAAIERKDFTPAQSGKHGS